MFLFVVSIDGSLGHGVLRFFNSWLRGCPVVWKVMIMCDVYPESLTFAII